MILPLVDKKIRQAFSNSALQYEVLAGLQKEIGRELTSKIDFNKDYPYVLDVGMGTGWMTNRLKNLFPASKVIGLDFADGMVNCAKKKYDELMVVQGDAVHLPFQAQLFDLIVSNLAYQWVPHLAKAFKDCHVHLKPKGKMFFTMFVQNTLRELFVSFEESLREVNTNDRTQIERLAHQEHVVDALKAAGFKNIQLGHETIRSHFPDMMSLVKWLKNIGANVLKKDIFIGKELMTKANDYYDKHFKDRLGIFATFEVIWIETEK